MKLKKKENQRIDASVCLIKVNKVLKGVNLALKCGAATKGKVIWILHHLWILSKFRPIPYSDTKPRHYWECQEVFADRCLI